MNTGFISSKQIWRVLFCLAMLISLMSATALAASAEGDVHAHSLNGDETLAWTGITSIGNSLSNGNYYLQGNVQCEKNISVSGNVNLCLNGKSLASVNEVPKRITINQGATLNICDCVATGTSSLVFENNGTLNIYGGTYGGQYIVDGKTYYNRLINNAGTLHIYDARIEADIVAVYNKGSLTIDNGSFGVASVWTNVFCIDNTGGIVEINGGSFTSSSSHTVYNNGGSAASLTINGGTFSNASNNGFVLYLTHGTCTISDGTFNACNTHTIKATAPVVIRDGSFASSENKYIVSNTNASGEISGGTFSTSNSPARIFIPSQSLSGGTFRNGIIQPAGAALADLLVSEEYAYFQNDEKVTLTGSGYSGQREVTGGDVVVKKIPATHTVSYDTAGGSTVATITANHGKTIASPDAPTRTGHTFDGWYKDADCTVAWNFAEDVVTEDITLHAKWKVNEYSIEYDGCGGYVLGSDKLPNLITTRRVRLPFGYPQYLPEATFVRPGYTLIGWNTKPDGSGEWWNENLTVPAHNETKYYAQWAANAGEMEPLYSAYSVTHYLQQLDETSYAEVTADTQFPLYAEIGDTVSAEAKSYAGYTYNAEKSTASAPVIRAELDDSGNPVYTRLELYYDLNSYTITFDTAGGSKINAITQKYGSAVAAPAAPTRDGYVFLGWDQDIPATIPAENLTITARWGILPVITAPLAEQTITVYEGEQATMPTIVAENAVSYQWQINYNDGTGWKDKQGENTPAYTTSPTKLADNGYRYRCIVTSADGESVYSPIFTLEVLKRVVLPETGDNAQIGLWCALVALSTAGMVLLLRKKKEA